MTRNTSDVLAEARSREDVYVITFIFGMMACVYLTICLMASWMRDHLLAASVSNTPLYDITGMAHNENLNRFASQGDWLMIHWPSLLVFAIFMPMIISANRSRLRAKARERAARR